MFLVISVDGISIVFILLTAFIFPFCVIAVQRMFLGRKLLPFLFIMEFFLFATFIVQDALLFFVMFESLLLPMFVIILSFGGRERRIQAVVYFLMYTLIGSVFLTIALFIIYAENRSTSFYGLQLVPFNYSVGRVLWVLLFFAFASKVPIFPFHI